MEKRTISSAVRRFFGIPDVENLPQSSELVNTWPEESTPNQLQAEKEDRIVTTTPQDVIAAIVDQLSEEEIPQTIRTVEAVTSARMPSRLVTSILSEKHTRIRNFSGTFPMLERDQSSVVSTIDISNDSLAVRAFQIRSVVSSRVEFHPEYLDAGSDESQNPVVEIEEDFSLLPFPSNLEQHFTNKTARPGSVIDLLEIRARKRNSLTSGDIDELKKVA